MAVVIGSLGLLLSPPVLSGRPDAKTPPQPPALTFAERVAYQRAIEEVYWRHRIWPKERAESKPSLDEIMPAEQLARKVQDYLGDAQLLDDVWRDAVTPVRLQAEMERMARQTQRPEVLKELFEALGNDPGVIAECLARPALSRRLLAQRYAGDARFHGELRRTADAELAAVRSVDELRGLTGKYREMEWVKSDSDEPAADGEAADAITLNPNEWSEHTRYVARMLLKSETGEARSTDIGPAGESSDWNPRIEVRSISRLHEDAERYYALAVINKTDERLRVAVVEWTKESFVSWRARQQSTSRSVAVQEPAAYVLPSIALGASACTDDTWTPTFNVPGARTAHTSVWTGSEMIVWGGSLIDLGMLDTGERYDPTTDVWTPVSAINAPAARSAHTAVWTGSEMIVWGGANGIGYPPTYRSAGGRYNPAADTWGEISSANAPVGRANHSAIWTGNAMIVWGGTNASGSGSTYLNTGARYIPATDTWLPTSTINAPTGRYAHTVVWTGIEMIVWGGWTEAGPRGPGARYNPITDTWVTMSSTGAPTERALHSAVWTGSHMIVWSGHDGTRANTGGRYDPITDSWSGTSTTNCPAGRFQHAAVWTGTEMIIWGGDTAGFANTGGRYHPGTNTWTPTSTDSAPAYRRQHTAIWTGNEMVVFGGDNYNESLNTGGRYNPLSDSWAPARTIYSPQGRSRHSAIWSGSEMIVWGGTGRFDALRSGGKYDPATDTWTEMTLADAPVARNDHTAIWTGSEMIVWGGWANTPSSIERYQTGGRYNPALDTWAATTTTNAPIARRSHTAVFTGSEMIVWGGEGGPTGSALNTGGRYNPGSDTWTETTTTNVPQARRSAAAFWTGSEMLVWGGQDRNTGAKYDPVADSWIPISQTNAPGPAFGHSAVWTGSEMIVWNPRNSPPFADGGRYNPATDSWVATSETNQPASGGDTAVWTGHEMIIWGGNDAGTGGRYNPTTDRWITTSTLGAPVRRRGATAVWTGDEMIVWGGYSGIAPAYRYSAVPSVPVLSVVSRMTHGAAGEFDIPLPLSGSPGVECRAGGATNDYTMIITFPADVTIIGNPGAAVTSGSGTVGSGGVANSGAVSINGNTVAVPLTNVADAQTINVTLYCVNGGGNVVVPMSRLLADINGNRAVNASDIGTIKADSGQTVTAANFRSDVNANGTINSSDIGQVKARSGATTP